MKRILIVSDLHCGNEWGLTPPGWWRGDSGELTKQVWDWWVKVAKAVKYDAVIVNGDVVDGGIDEMGHLTLDRGEQAEIAVRCLKEIHTKKMVMTYGTPAHTVAMMDIEKIVAEKLGAPIKAEQRVEADGIKIHARHVVGSWGTPYTGPTQIMKEAVRQRTIDKDNGVEPPDVVVRSHIHAYHKAEAEGMVGVTTPCLQLPLSVYGRTRRAWKYDIGVVVIEIQHKRLWVEPVLLKLKYQGVRYEKV